MKTNIIIALDRDGSYCLTTQHRKGYRVHATGMTLAFAKKLLALLGDDK